MLFLIRQTLRAGVCTEPTPEPNDDWRLEAERIQADVLALLGRALTIRQVDAGSCNGCELEIHGDPSGQSRARCRSKYGRSGTPVVAA